MAQAYNLQAACAPRKFVCLISVSLSVFGIVIASRNIYPQILKSFLNHEIHQIHENSVFVQDVKMQAGKKLLIFNQSLLNIQELMQ